MKKTLLAIAFLLPMMSNAQTITTVAGTGIPGYSGDGAAATLAQLDRPSGLIVNPKRDGPEYVYVADYANNVIRRVNTSGNISTVAGTGTAGYSGDGGPAIAAEFNGPCQLFQDTAGNVYVSDYLNNVVRKIDILGNISTVAGNGTGGYNGDGGQATNAKLHGPSGMAIDGAGNIYIADFLNNVIRKVNAVGIISTFAGNGSTGYSGDGGQATAAQFNLPQDVCVDHSGNLYIADANNSCIRKVNSSGIITTIAGTNVAGYNGDGIAATAAKLYNPYGIVIDPVGNLYIADQNNARIRKINTSGIISTLAGNGTVGSSGDGGLAINAQLNIPSGVCLDGNGFFFVADQMNHKIRRFSVCSPTIISEPVADTVNSGSTATFIVTSPTATSYQWQRDSSGVFVDLADVSPYSGVTTNTLTITNTSTSLNSASYRCMISGNSLCIDSTAAAVLTVHNGVGINKLSAASINVFPNPVQDNITIELPYAVTNGSIRLINETGQVVTETTVTGKTAHVATHSLPNGMYFLKIEVNGQILYKKMVKN